MKKKIISTYFRWDKLKIFRFFFLTDIYWNLLIFLVLKLNLFSFKQKHSLISHITPSCGNLFYIVFALWKNEPCHWLLMKLWFSLLNYFHLTDIYYGKIWKIAWTKPYIYHLQFYKKYKNQIPFFYVLDISIHI